MKMFKNINFDRLKKGLDKTRDKIVNRISETISGKANIDDDVLDELEEVLITSDIGYDLSVEIIENTRKLVKKENDRSRETVLKSIRDELARILTAHSNYDDIYDEIKKYKPYIILVVGVNGAGKTTTIGKLAYNYKMAGLNVVIGSADTFRAAANEQLDVWAKRAGVEIVQSISGNDPAAIAYDTLNIAKRKNADVVLIDTAGRLHTKNNLMNELQKINKVLSKVFDYAPNETFLVLDGNTGQNALIQAREFAKYTGLSGLIITKLDGTAKGGIIFQVSAEQKIPLRYIGVGEGIEDLQVFSPEDFVKAIFNN